MHLLFSRVAISEAAISKAIPLEKAIISKLEGYLINMVPT